MENFRGNYFFAPPGISEARRGSGRVYAAVEVAAPGGDAAQGQADDYASEPVVLECIECRWLDEVRDGGTNWQELHRKAPLSVILLDSYELPAPHPDAPPGDVAWYQLGYEYSSEAKSNAHIFTNLYTAGVPIWVEWNEPRPGWGQNGPGQRLGWLGSTSSSSLFENEASSMERGDWADRLGNLKTSSGVAIYDVGQGTCQALVDKVANIPMLYVDLGGGVLWNRETFPQALRGFCFTASPAVILSHWDWDHWSSAPLFPKALNAQWLAPPVPGKPIQQAFAAELSSRGRLTIWKSSWPNELKAGSVRIEKCTGTSENDRGLAVTFYSRRRAGRNMLLPGDADYQYVPSVATDKFNALCMTHHGGKLHSSTYPMRKRTGSVAINSSGPRNTYRHPLLPTLTTHADAGWPFPAQTGFSGQRPCHVLVPWGQQSHFFHGGCHGNDKCSIAVARVAPTCTSVLMFAPLGPLGIKKTKAPLAATVPADAIF